MRRIAKKLNRKAQLNSIIAFVAVIVALLITAPIVLKIFNSVTGGFATSVQNTSADAYNAVTYGQTTVNTFWDYVILVAFITNVLLLFVTSFLIDMHPALVVLYIIGGIFLFFIGPVYITSVDKIFTNSQFTTEVANMPNTTWLYSNFLWVLLGIYFATGVIMFVKFKFFSGQQNKQGGYFG